MRKLSIVVISVFVIASFLLSGPVLAQDKKPYKIGGIFPLTGYLSWLGEYKKKGAELEVELINKAGGVNGHPLELSIYDDQSSPEQGTKVAQRLISKDGVVAIAGTASVPISGAVASIANRYKIPTVINSGYAIDPAKDAFIFNSSHPTEFAIARPLQYFKKTGITKVALLEPIGPLGELGSSVSRKYAAQYGITVVGEEKFDVKATDVTAQLAKLRSLNPQAILAFTTGEPAALLARNMAQMNMDIPLVPSHGNATPGFLKLVSNVPGTIIVPSGKVMIPDALAGNDPSKKVIQEFNKAHIDKFKEPANYFSAELADGIALIAEAIKRANSTDGQKVKEAMEGIRNFPRMQGVYNLSPTDHYGTKIDDMILLVIKNGKWQALKE